VREVERLAGELVPLIPHVQLIHRPQDGRRRAFLPRDASGCASCLDSLRAWQSERKVRRVQQRKAATALETIEQVLSSLARIPEQDHALAALVTAIETDRDRLRTRQRQGRAA